MTAAPSKAIDLLRAKLARIGLADNRVELLCAAAIAMAELFPRQLVEQVIRSDRPTKRLFCLAIRSHWTYRPADTASIHLLDLMPPDDSELLRIVAEHEDTGLAPIHKPQRRRPADATA